MTRGLCTICGTFFDEPPAAFKDKCTKSIVLLCRVCAGSRFTSEKYERISEDPPKKGKT